MILFTCLNNSLLFRHVRRKTLKDIKKYFIFILASIFMNAPLYAQKYSVQSPDGHIALTVSNQELLTYSVQLDGKTLIAPSPMGFLTCYFEKDFGEITPF